jgi:hypothetical protein
MSNEDSFEGGDGPRVGGRGGEGEPGEGGHEGTGKADGSRGQGRGGQGEGKACRRRRATSHSSCCMRRGIGGCQTRKRTEKACTGWIATTMRMSCHPQSIQDEVKANTVVTYHLQPPPPASPVQ